MNEVLLWIEEQVVLHGFGPPVSRCIPPTQWRGSGWSARSERLAGTARPPLARDSPVWLVERLSLSSLHLSWPSSPRVRPEPRRRRARRRSAATAPTASRSTTPAPARITAASPSGSPAVTSTRHDDEQHNAGGGRPVDVGKTSCSRRERRRAAASSARTLTGAARPAPTTRSSRRRSSARRRSAQARSATCPDSEKHQVERRVRASREALRHARSRSTTSSRSSSAAPTTSPTSTRRRRSAGTPGYHVKDKLENKLHDLVCDGAMTLRSVQQQIAANWQALYKKVFGVAPSG